MAYIYCHYKIGSPSKIFYIGVGGLNKFDNYNRAKDSRGRSNLWKEFSSKVDWSWDIASLAANINYSIFRTKLNGRAINNTNFIQC